jgi:hypothetical protein
VDFSVTFQKTTGICKYHADLVSLIRASNNRFQMDEYYLSMIGNGNIKYAKATYSKSIPVATICEAKSLMDSNGIGALTRAWHNSKPEGSSRGCNLTIIKEIVSHFP